MHPARDPGAHFVDPVPGWELALEPEQPLVLIDLDSNHSPTLPARLPPVPVIGVGGRSLATAALLDAVVEPPFTVESLVRTILTAPAAAAVAVQLLRSAEGLVPDRAVVLESLAYGLLQASAEHRSWLEARPREQTLLAAGRVAMERQGPRLRLVLDRPGARNAIDRPMRDALFEGFTLATLDHEVEVVELRSIGPAFSIGGDLAEFGTTSDAATAHAIRSRTLPALAVCRRGFE